MLRCGNIIYLRSVVPGFSSYGLKTILRWRSLTAGVLIRRERKGRRVKINYDNCNMFARHKYTLLACDSRLINYQSTAPVFRRHAYNCRVMGINRKFCEIRIVVVIDQPWSINHVDMHTLSIVITVLIIYVRMRKRSHALQEYEKQQ